ncbi:MAG: hypothetical protein KDH96_06585 [Candidatus Riesia sp.]|nr:hypothetical protein [Candidatus Riesia sp.]
MIKSIAKKVLNSLLYLNCHKGGSIDLFFADDQVVRGFELNNLDNDMDNDVSSVENLYSQEIFPKSDILLVNLQIREGVLSKVKLGYELLLIEKLLQLYKVVIAIVPVRTVDIEYKRNISLKEMLTSFLTAIVYMPTKSVFNKNTATLVFDRSKKSPEISFYNFFALKEQDLEFDDFVLENPVCKVNSSTIFENNCSWSLEDYLNIKAREKIENSLGETVSISSFVENIIRSQSIAPKSDSCNVLEITGSDIPHYGFISKKGLFYKKADYEKASKYRVEPFRDVLLSVKGQTGLVGLVGEISKLCVASQMFVILRCRNPFDAKYLYMFLKSKIGGEYLKLLTKKVKYDVIPSKNYRNMSIPISMNNSGIEHLFDEIVGLYNKIDYLQNKMFISKIKSYNNDKE